MIYFSGCFAVKVARPEGEVLGRGSEPLPTIVDLDTFSRRSHLLKAIFVKK